VTITATSVDDSSVHASADVTVAGGMAITITTPVTTLDIPTETSVTFVATVENDPANAGVTWSCSTTPCGTVAPATSASGEQVTYTAPLLPNGGVADVTLTATSVSDPSLTSSVNLTVHGRRIDLYLQGNNPVDAVVLAARATAQFTADIVADPTNHGGVSWALKCGASDCGALSAATSASGAPVTYTAPPGPIASDVVVTVTVASISRPDVQGTGTVTVAAVAVTVTPDSALVPLKAWSFFTGNLQWAPTDGVTWSVVQNSMACGNVCGSFAPAQTLNGQEVTYTAPSVMPPSAVVTLVSTSVFDHTKSASAAIKLTTGNVLLVPDSLHLHRSGHSYQGKLKCSDGRGTARLTNVGGPALVISGITIGGANPEAFSETNTCSSPLGAGLFCDVSVKFNCAYRAGSSARAVISIADSSADSPQQLALAGDTNAAAVSASVRRALSVQSAISTPAPTGRHTIGTRVLSLSDPRYADPYLANGSARELMVRFWYPAVATKDCAHADYASPQVWEYFSSLLEVALPQVSTHSCRDAAVDTGRHAVVVLTHGFTGTYTDYTFLAEDLASRGYIVASVNHTHEATATELADGRLEKSVYGSHLKRYTRYDADSLAQAVTVRLQDLRFVLNQLTELNQTPGPFAGRLDLTRVALAGHSLGGLTTLRALATEPRFKVGIVLDGTLPPQPLESVRQPVLAVMAGIEPENRDECRMWKALRGPRAAVALPGAEHLALSDAVWLAGTAISTGSAGPDRLVSSVRRNVASFLDATFGGESAAQAVAAARASFPGARVAIGAQLTCSAQ